MIAIRILEIIVIVIAEEYDGKNIESIKMYFIAFWFLIVNAFFVSHVGSFGEEEHGPIGTTVCFT